MQQARQKHTRVVVLGHCLALLKHALKRSYCFNTCLPLLIT